MQQNINRSNKERERERDKERRERLTPEAVRIGFAFSLGNSCLRCEIGIAAMISTSFGIPLTPYFEDTYERK